MKKAVVAVLTSMALVVTMVACGTGNQPDSQQQPQSSSNAQTAPTPSGEKVKLVLATPGQDVDQAAFDKVMQEFYKENPNIEVEAIAVPNTGWADYIAKIKTMIAGGTAPDVIRIAVQGINEMVSQELALPLERDLVDLSAYYPQEVISYSTVNDALYGLPWDANNVVLHINKDLVASMGATMPASNDWTLDEFIKFGQSISMEKDGKKVFAYAMPHNYFATSAWLFNNGASFFNDDMTECTIDSPEAVEVFQLLQDMIYKYNIAPQPTPESNYTNQFISGQVAMITAGRWTQGTYIKNNMNSVVLQPLPKLKQNVTCYGYGVYSAMSATKHPEESKKLAAFMAGEYSQANYLDSGNIPSMKKIAQQVVPQKAPVPGNHELFISSPYPVKIVESPKVYSSVEAIFNRYYSSLLANEITAQDMCKNMKMEIDDLLK